MPPPSSKVSRIPLLHVYLAQLAEHPLRTKALTSGEYYRTASFLSCRWSQRTHPKGTLCFLQEVLGSHLAGVPVRQPADAPLYSHVLARAKVSTRAVKVALYGFLVSAPLSHALVGELQRAFAGKTGRTARLGQIFASNLIVSPIQTFCESLLLFFFFSGALALLLGSRDWGCDEAALFHFFGSLYIYSPFAALLITVGLVYLVSFSIISGARSWNSIKKDLMGAFLPVMKVCF